MNSEKHSISDYYWTGENWWTKESNFRVPTNFDEIIKIHNRLIDAFAAKNPHLDLLNMRDRLEFSAYAYQLWDNFFYNGFIVDAEGYFFFSDGKIVNVEGNPLDIEKIVAKYD